MLKILRYKYHLIALLLMGALLGFSSASESGKYKCMIQMINYQGEGAYIIVSLINSEGKYVKTLNVLGKGSRWYQDIPSWWKFYSKNRTNIDGISGATLGGGDRGVRIIKIEKDKINAGYKLRFESAVEGKGYHEKDVEFNLTTEMVNGKIEGKGFIRYVRIIPQ